jgi:hypothetical protein
MKLTKSKLKQLIREELQDPPRYNLNDIGVHLDRIFAALAGADERIKQLELQARQQAMPKLDRDIEAVLSPKAKKERGLEH